MQFFNVDSLASVNDTLTKVQDSLIITTDSLIVLADSAIILSDSLFTLEALINQGQTELIPIRDELRADSTIIVNDLQVVRVNDSILVASNSKWTTVQNNITTGRVLVSEVRNLNNGNIINFSDSATAFSIPLDMNNDSSALGLTLGSNLFELTLQYQRIESEDEKGRITVQTSGFKTLKSTFDADTINCKNEDCIDSETTIRLYF